MCSSSLNGFNLILFSYKVPHTTTRGVVDLDARVLEAVLCLVKQVGLVLQKGREGGLIS